MAVKTETAAKKIKPLKPPELFDRIPREKRERVLRAAADEFSAKGYENANTNIIAEKAGISVGALFKYFKTKEACFIAVLSEGIRHLEEALDHITGSKDPFFKKIEMIVNIIPEHSRKYGEMIRLYYEVTRNSGSDTVSRLGARMEGISARIYRKMIKQAKKEGIVNKTADEDVFAFCLDNLFIMLQFSYACKYYKKRKEIYLGRKKAGDDRHLTGQVMKFIKGALSPRELK